MSEKMEKVRKQLLLIGYKPVHTDFMANNQYTYIDHDGLRCKITIEEINGKLMVKKEQILFYIE
jgi:hypothetical protein